METFKLGQQLESSQFVINGLKLCINLYPNGRCGCRTEYVVNFTMISKKGSFVLKFLFFNRNDEEGGFVSLFLRNDNSIQMEVDPLHHQANYASYSIFQVMCQFTLGVKNSFKHHFSFNKINPNSGYGFPKIYSHEQINAKEVLFNNIYQIFW